MAVPLILQALSSLRLLALALSFVWDTLSQIPADVAHSLTLSDLSSNVIFLVKSSLPSHLEL